MINLSELLANGPDEDRRFSRYYTADLCRKNRFTWSRIITIVLLLPSYLPRVLQLRGVHILQKSFQGVPQGLQRSKCNNSC
jgi:hypothetical protein